MQLERFSKFYQRRKRNHTPVLDSGSDCVSGKNNKNIVLVSLFMALFGTTKDSFSRHGRRMLVVYHLAKDYELYTLFVATVGLTLPDCHVRR